MGCRLWGRTEPDTTEAAQQQHSMTAGTEGLESSEQSRRVTDWRRERRWEMAELQGPEQ